MSRFHLPRPAAAAVLAAACAAATGLAGSALAQDRFPGAPLTVRVRPEPVPMPDVYARAAARGPVVLAYAPGPLPPGTAAGLVAIRAVPVASVTNGGAFGPTGFGYYSDGVSEGPLNGGRRINTYILGSRAY
ncbi:hypothetical protein OPKNFCMD_4785 [Methylobacterium crusticola]|uniref:Plug domain-containing protein n=1 Tax=Methylobacterium crusticola TaxID=1697972 RepID=A0ABQ4R385_9HYPH|nr:hypothetical protein [Methylobacterium crusticola]GJD52023.1 hypothetical protein OPKNFCMD_4785 [Methylobacterium crusticola]